MEKLIKALKGYNERTKSNLRIEIYGNGSFELYDYEETDDVFGTQDINVLLEFLNEMDLDI